VAFLAVLKAMQTLPLLHRGCSTISSRSIQHPYQ